MRKLDGDKRQQILASLVEGSSVRAIVRMCGVSKLTVLRLVCDVGALYRDLHDLMVQDVKAERVQIDEIGSFVGCKEKTGNAGGRGRAPGEVLDGCRSGRYP